CHSPPPPPLSFPTRRSSDLLFCSSALPRSSLLHLQFAARPRERVAREVLAGAEPIPLNPLRGRGEAEEAVGAEALRGLVPDDARSEEHTSELQSRENLVCRL